MILYSADKWLSRAVTGRLKPNKKVSRMRFTFILGGAFFLKCATAVSAPAQAQVDAALAEVRAEEVVFDTSWSEGQPPLLSARVFDNGSQRNSYAGYLCMIMAEHAIDDVIVSVVDVASSDQRELGRADCRMLKR